MSTDAERLAFATGVVEADLETAARLARDRCVEPRGALALFSSPAARDLAHFVGLRDCAALANCVVCSSGAATTASDETCSCRSIPARGSRGAHLRAIFDADGKYVGAVECARDGLAAARALDGVGDESVEREFAEAAVARLRESLDCEVGEVLWTRLEQRASQARSEIDGERARFSARIVVQGEELGLLSFARRKGAVPFSEDDEKRIASLADRIGELVSRQRLASTMGNLAGRVEELERGEVAARLVAEAAHDLRNVLTAVAGYCGLLSMGAPGPGASEHIRGIESVVARATALLRRIMDVRRGRGVSVRQTNVTERLRGLQPLLAATLGSRIRVDIEAEDDLPLASVDAEHLELALLNLALNAKGAMPEGGSLHLRASSFGTLADRKLWLALDVSDTGPGFAEEARAAALRPDAPSGVIPSRRGIGLSSVWRFLRGVGGALEIENCPGAGAHVRMRLPVESAPAQTAKKFDHVVSFCRSADADACGSTTGLDEWFAGSCEHNVSALANAVRRPGVTAVVVRVEGEEPDLDPIAAVAAVAREVAIVVLTDRPLTSEFGARATRLGADWCLDRTMPPELIAATIARLAPRAKDPLSPVLREVRRG